MRPGCRAVVGVQLRIVTFDGRAHRANLGSDKSLVIDRLLIALRSKLDLSSEGRSGTLQGTGCASVTTE